jgi:RNA polymerase sigma-70 factor, ECF subfamily
MTGEAAMKIEETDVAAAAAGDQAAFERLVESQRPSIHAHCYRMLGALHDADDMLQETLLRAWRALPRFRGESSFRTWLFRIATNVCLDAIARRPKRILPRDHGPPNRGGEESDEPRVESIWIEPYPDDEIGIRDDEIGPDARYEQREALELAFIAALQHLPARQRAALVLRDVLGFSSKEAAGSMETTVASVNGALSRARRAMEERLPDRSQQATLRTLGDRPLREMAERFADAFERGDIDAILAMLTEDATFEMPPYSSWNRGRAEIAESWLMPAGPAPRLRYVPTRANGQLALGTYLLDPESGSYLPLALDVLALEGGMIGAVIAFRDVSLFPSFGLPPQA